MKREKLLRSWLWPWHRFLHLSPLSAVFTAAWVLSMLGVPIALWTIGPDAIPLAIQVSVLLQAAAVLAILSARWGWEKTACTAALIATLGWLLEAVGTATGLPFGVYVYTNRLQPQIAHVPVLIPLAWMMMLPVSWGVGALLSRLGPRRSPPFAKGSFILLSAFAMTAWDLFLDPQMVLWDFWRWRDVGAISYFGIPWLNYSGWLLGSAAITAVVRPDVEALPTRPLLLIYAITWFLETFGLLFFWGLAGPALVGGLVMGSLTGLAWKSSRQEKRES